METARLKSFATAARTQLIREVDARIAVVLGASSPARVESNETVNALERAIADAGGGDAGRVAITERVGYTWFNRIVALRFMDVNGYTGVGVVSPEQRRTSGQPEILADAKRGEFDTEVVDARTANRVTQLLNGTRRSHDPQGEAYGHLLAAYCHFWNRAMPFMFQERSDYTELLIPDDLLAEGSVLSNAVKMITPEDCTDVEVIGWLYQFYISERKDEVFAGFKKNKKAGAAEIPAATQLFTPHWIVRYLVENSLGRLWLLNRPSSSLANKMDYYIAPIDEETDFLKVASPEEIKILDPACGSGHMLTYAFDLLYAIYEEEGYAPADIPTLILSNNLYGTEIDERAGSLAAFALTMKARAKQRGFLSKSVTPNICVMHPIRFSPNEIDELTSSTSPRSVDINFWNQFEHADALGSLIRPNEELLPLYSNHAQQNVAESIWDTHRNANRVIVQAEYLTRRYNVVIANPPYMGSKNWAGTLSKSAKVQFPISSQNLYSMFIERCIELAAPYSFIGMVTMDGWMFSPAYRRFRTALLDSSSIRTMAHLGTRAFGTIGGEVVSTTAFVVAKNGGDTTPGTYIRLTEGAEECEKRQALLDASGLTIHQLRYTKATRDFKQVPGEPIIYWASAHDIKVLAGGPMLETVLQTREGLTTGDNDSFLRLWHEVSRCRIGLSSSIDHIRQLKAHKWFPYVKGGGSRRWFGYFDYVLNWEEDGRAIRRNIDPETGRVRSHNYNGEFAFRPGLTWSGISSDGFAVRHVPGGCMFDAKGPMGFADSNEQLYSIEAFLNSTVATHFMRLLAPTLDFKITHVLSLPLRLQSDPQIEHHVKTCIQLAKQDWDSSERSLDFSSSPLLTANSPKLSSAVARLRNENQRQTNNLRQSEDILNQWVSDCYGTEGDTICDRTPTIDANEAYRFGRLTNIELRSRIAQETAITDLISYSVGCMFGRYSLALPGLILANQGDTLEDYVAKVPDSNFLPKADNVIPIIDGEWFADDIVARFRQFLRVSFGVEHFEENLRYIEETLGKPVRRYFVSDFYKDHVQRYKNRPIYWLFSSPKGSFNALIYMHRYAPSTVSTVLNEYLREFQAKLQAELQHQERVTLGADSSPRDKTRSLKEVERLRKLLLELEVYEHGVLYPLATQQISIDLDDGVKVNYPKFGAALKRIPELEARDG